MLRGAATVLNWASGEGEIQSLLDRAFDQLLVKLSADLEASCERVRAAPTSPQ